MSPSKCPSDSKTTSASFTKRYASLKEQFISGPTSTTFALAGFRYLTIFHSLSIFGQINRRAVWQSHTKTSTQALVHLSLGPTPLARCQSGYSEATFLLSPLPQFSMKLSWAWKIPQTFFQIFGLHLACRKLELVIPSPSKADLPDFFTKDSHSCNIFLISSFGVEGLQYLL